MKNIRNAIIIMLVVICGSSAFSAVSSMNSMVSKLEDHFFNGDTAHNDNKSIYNDIVDKTEIATNLVSLSKEYISASDDHVKSIQSAVNDISSEKSIGKLYKLVKTLDTNVDWLISELSGRNLSSTHKELLKKYQSQYRSETNTINSDNYNTLVREYFDEVNGFPGSIFKIFSSKAEYFE